MVALAVIATFIYFGVITLRRKYFQDIFYNSPNLIKAQENDIG
jgi:hypothetical protein